MLSSKEKEAFKRHLDTIGLDSVQAYRSWCSEHGFDDAIKKHWRERRKEQLVAKRLATKAPDEEDLKAHLEAMGMKSTGAYQAWCRRHGFNAKLYKSHYQRVQERRLLGQQKIQAKREGGMSHTRQTNLIERLYRGEVPKEDLTHPYLQTIHDAFASCRATEDVEVAEAFMALLNVSEQQANFFNDTPVVGHLGPVPGNTFVEGLYALARFHGDWLRPVEDWTPDSHIPHRQFSILARHLLAKYQIPVFMDTAWFKGSDPAAVRQQAWFREIGAGKNIRSLDIPIPLSKMMAHRFLEAPDDFSVEWALRWGQIFGMGGGEDLVHAIVATRLGERFEDDEFWKTVLYFFINNPMLDTAYVTPVVDYIYNQRYVAPDIVQPDGTVVKGNIPQPDFTMKGRTVESMLELVEAWHGTLSKPVRRKTELVAWNRTNIAEFEYVDEKAEEKWSITELLNEQELAEEGSRMHHCVRTYTESCRKREVSIWSIKMESMKTVFQQRVLTVAVRRDHSITQIRGVKNAQPDDNNLKGRKNSGIRRHYDLLRQGRRVLDMWIDREGLNVLRQT